jgi:hypothetical protein
MEVLFTLGRSCCEAWKLKSWISSGNGVEPHETVVKGEKP